jgi:integrase
MRTKMLPGIDQFAERGHRRQVEEEKPSKKVFRQFAVEYIANDENGWRNAVHRAQWSSSLSNYVFSTIGHIPVDEINAKDICGILRAIGPTKAETASRVRSRIERILDAAKVLKLRAGDNPAAWNGNLSSMLPPQKRRKDVRHRTALPYGEVPAFMEMLRERDAVAARALEFTILTAARTMETLSATWIEVDLATKTWIIPKERMNASSEHKVPLSDRAVEIIKEMAAIEFSDFIFAGVRGGLSNSAMLRVLGRLGRSDLTVYGFRSTFRKWASEATAYPNHLVQMALARGSSDELKAASMRRDLFAEHAKLMDEWGKYCSLRV